MSLQQSKAEKNDAAPVRRAGGGGKSGASAAAHPPKGGVGGPSPHNASNTRCSSPCECWSWALLGSWYQPLSQCSGLVSSNSLTSADSADILREAYRRVFSN